MMTGMKSSSSTPATAWSHRRAAFSLIEVMVVVGLMSVMILGLMAMFNQTQRAFRLGMSQTDILESGRLVTDLTSRELEQITPSFMNRTNVGNAGNPIGGTYDFAPNVYSETVNVFLQSLPGTGARRTNILTDVFFLIRQNQSWSGIGYFVRTNRADNPQFPGGVGPLGTLYRFETNTPRDRFDVNPEGLFAGFLGAINGDITNHGVSKVLDGVAHFHVRHFDTDGWPLTNNPSWFIDHLVQQGNFLGRPEAITNGTIQAFNTYPLSGELGRFWFFSNAVPASLELELGVLETQFAERYRAFPVYTAQTNFLAQQAAHVHLFRQRVAVRNVDPSVYQ